MWCQLVEQQSVGMYPKCYLHLDVNVSKLISAIGTEAVMGLV